MPLFTNATLVAADPPRETVAPDWKPVPVTVIDVPPAVGPDVGEIALTVGAGEVVPPPLDLARTVLSFFNDPGAVLKYVWGESTI